MWHCGDSHWTLARGLLIGAVVTAVVMLSFPVVAAVGSNLILGQSNSADAITSLSGAAATNLRITNTQAASPALDLRVVSGSAPLKVNSTARVANLNADRLDGKHGGAYALVDHLHTGLYLGVDDTAVNADNLDGLDSSEFASAFHGHPVSSGPQTFFRTANAGEDVTIATSVDGVFSLVLHCTETRTTLRWHYTGVFHWYTGTTYHGPGEQNVDIAYTESEIQTGYASGLGTAFNSVGHEMILDESSLVLAHDHPVILSGTKACVAIGNVSLGRSLDGN
jgi:hypothetical protein